MRCIDHLGRQDRPPGSFGRRAGQSTLHHRAQVTPDRIALRGRGFTVESMHQHDSAQHPELTPGAGPRHAPVAQRPADTSLQALVGTTDLIELQRSAGNGAVADAMSSQTTAVADVLGGSGRPLESSVRQDMESRLGHDFSDVRIHDDAAAHDSAVGINAHAYTVGSDIVFQRSAYAPDTAAGMHTLAHELTHVVQQRNGPVEGTDSGGGLSISDPSDRFEREAEETASQVVH